MVYMLEKFASACMTLNPDLQVAHTYYQDANRNNDYTLCICSKGITEPHVTVEMRVSGSQIAWKAWKGRTLNVDKLLNNRTYHYTGFSTVMLYLHDYTDLIPGYSTAVVEYLMNTKDVQDFELDFLRFIARADNCIKPSAVHTMEPHHNAKVVCDRIADTVQLTYTGTTDTGLTLQIELLWDAEVSRVALRKQLNDLLSDTGPRNRCIDYDSIMNMVWFNVDLETNYELDDD
jgi:S-ribosylhomocysteine lyase LuxS involved in autoinducer biosynthesis